MRSKWPAGGREAMGVAAIRPSFATNPSAIFAPSQRDAPAAAGTSNPPHECIERKAGEQDQTGVTVRLEQHQAKIGIANVEARHLPAEMRGECRKSSSEDKPGARQETGNPDQQDSGAIEHHQDRPGTLAE